MSQTFNMTKCLDELSFHQAIGFSRFIIFNPKTNTEEARNDFIEQTAEESFKGYLKPITLELEISAWMYIASGANIRLSEYQSTLESDIKALKEEKMSTNRRLCIEQRMIEKQILHHIIAC